MPVEIIGLPKRDPNKVYRMFDHERDMVKQIKDKVGLVEAVKVVRLILKCDFKTAFDFVKEL
jgi:hypothetical protein